MNGEGLIGLVPIAFGGALIIFARQITNASNRLAEWQITIMRQHWFSWYYRLFGAVFVVAGIAFLVQSLSSE